jgi:hypothetical protein
MIPAEFKNEKQPKGCFFLGEGGGWWNNGGIVVECLSAEAEGVGGVVQ